MVIPSRCRASTDLRDYQFLSCAFERPYERLLMFIVHVFVQVKPDCLAAFREASIENARHSIQEPGIVRFDFIQQRDDPTQFVLVEVYRTEADTTSHKRTAHYAKWQATVEELLAQPRSRIFYQNIFPEDQNW
jgi:(4S)-4-hydroxy-5-phosphonooxypentane-2,3-dione isomerase